jgi:hypothetical protein
MVAQWSLLVDSVDGVDSVDRDGRGRERPRSGRNAGIIWGEEMRGPSVNGGGSYRKI